MGSHFSTRTRTGLIQSFFFVSLRRGKKKQAPKMKLACIFGVFSVVAAMAMGTPAETEETRPEMQAVSADELKSREEHRAADPAKNMEKEPKALAALLKLNRLKSRRANDPGAELAGNKTNPAKRSAYCGLIGEEANLWHCISWLLPINRVKSNRAKAPGAESAGNKKGQAKRAAYCGLKGEGANLWHCIDWIPLFKIWG